MRQPATVLTRQRAPQPGTAAEISGAAARRRLSQPAEHSPGRARDHRAELDATGEIAHCEIIHRHVNPTPVSRDYTCVPHVRGQKTHDSKTHGSPATAHLRRS